MLVLKDYQKRTLAALEEFLTFARIINPAEAFKRVTAKNPTGKLSQTYYTRWDMKNVPYICLRLPTGGGKTLLAAHCISIAASSFLQREYPFVFWLVPTKTIREQTVEALKKPFHPYREALDASFGLGNVCVFDIEDINNIRPKDAFEKTCIIVTTMQTLRVEDSHKDNRKVYGHNENFEPHFKALPNNAPNLDRKEDGQVLFSFVNMVHQLRPLVIVDEAHKMISDLSGETMKRVNPACVIEFTATPVESNVLYRAYPSELKEEEMVKLPFKLTEHTTWKQAVTEASLNRKMLEEYAIKDVDAYIRPIILFQAEKKNKECTVDVLKSFLLENNINESEIAIATGAQRELDGINLFDKTCPIKYIITIEALKEGWDCSFAYVFCSVANIRSATDVEQLLGRVMRMPYAKARKIKELNMAYAHVISPSFNDAAEGMYNRMVNMGFDGDEAASNLQRQLSLLDSDEKNPWEGSPLFKENNSPKTPLFTTILKKNPDFTDIPQEELEHISIEKISDGTIKLVSTSMIPHAVENKIIEVTKESEKENVRRKISLHRQQIASSLPLSPSQKQIPFAIPRMLVEIYGSLEWAEPETFLHALNWSPLDFAHHLAPEEFSYSPDSKAFIFDLDGERMVYTRDDAQVQYTLLEMPQSWDELKFSRWLDRKCQQEDINQVQMLEFCRQCVSGLLSHNDLDLITLYRAKDALVVAIKAKINKLRLEAQKKGYQQFLFSPNAKVEVSFKEAFNFPLSGYAESYTRYSGGYRFKKYYYPLPRDLKASGEEFRCAQAIDAHPKIETWVRNVDRQGGSFSLPTSTDKFYPDFVAKLIDGRILVVEYKGAHLLNNDDSKEKKNIGELWASKSKGQGLFLMATEDAKGKSIEGQLNAALV